MGISSAISLIGFVIGVVLLLPLIVAGIFVIVVVANRADPDPSGRRPAVVYAFGTAFVTLFATLFATTALVASVCQLIGSHTSGNQFDLNRPAISIHPIGDAVARGSVISGLIALAAGTAFALHILAGARGSRGAPLISPVARVRASYVSAVSFLCVLIAIGASVFAVYDIFRIAAPGVFTPNGSQERVNVLRSFIPALYLAFAAVAILLAHLNQASPPFRLSPLTRPAPRPAPAAPAPPPASAPPGWSPVAPRPAMPPSGPAPSIAPPSAAARMPPAAGRGHPHAGQEPPAALGPGDRSW